MNYKDEDDLIIARLNDKLKYCKINNKIVNTNFLDMHEEHIIKKELIRNKEKRYLFNGGYENAESKLLILYPEKFSEEIINTFIKDIIKVIRIKLPKDQENKYEHRIYLGVLMSFGLERERIGDIIVYANRAYIIVLHENVEYIKNSLQQTLQFKKSKIDIIEIDELEIKEQEFEEFKISVSSFRLDNIVSEITKTSRNIANQLINQEKVFINGIIEKKQTKLVNENDILIIRGYGKYIFFEKGSVNSKGKIIFKVKKYI